MRCRDVIITLLRCYDITPPDASRCLLPPLYHCLFTPTPMPDILLRHADFTIIYLLPPVLSARGATPPAVARVIVMRSVTVRERLMPALAKRSAPREMLIAFAAYAICRAVAY